MSVLPTQGRILGIDPGTRVAGYGIIDFSGSRQRAVAVGTWRLPAQEPLARRLYELQRGVRDVIARFNPQVVCVELAFVADNVRSALFLGHARGVVMAEACAHQLPVHEVSATQAKKILTDHGRADKKIVARTLSQVLGIDLSQCLPDASDALCIAYAAAIMAHQRGFAVSPQTGAPSKRSSQSHKFSLKDLKPAAVKG